MNPRLLTEAARLASARAASQRRHNARNRLVRVTGPDGGEFTIDEIAARLGVDAKTASTAFSRVRHNTLGKPTWAALEQRTNPLRAAL